MNRKWLLVLMTQLIGCVCITLPLSVLASPLVSVSSVGGGTFQIEGAGIEGAAAFDLSLSYDASSLSNPRVVTGTLVAGSMMEANTNTSGVVRIAIIRITPIIGNGTIATVSFNQNGESVGKIHSLNAKLLDINGQPLRVATQIINTSETSAKKLLASTSASITAAIVNPSTDEKQLLDELPLQPVAQPEMLDQTDIPNDLASDSIKPPSADVAPAEQTIIYKSVLYRFMEFSGKRNFESANGLFSKPVSAECNQTPLVVLSDGKSPVTVLLTPTTSISEISNFVVTSAQLVSFNENPNLVNSWIVNLLPTKGSVVSNFAYKQGRDTVVCPLTIAPEVDIDVDKSDSITDADVRLYFNTKKSKKTLRFDLNQDGKQDYQDDYIFVANYLVATNPKKVSAAKKSISLSK
jgi:hypothetical protein